MNAILERLLAGRDLSLRESERLFAVLTDPATPAPVVSALLVALRAKGETPTELRGMALAMRARALPCNLGPADGLVDVVGTGGDHSGSFNLSTGSALLAAAAGARVVKHGGGAVSSRAGSADVLARLGLPLPLATGDARALFQATGFTFLHAPYFHVALRGLGPLRRALGTRTVFNLLGPLCNPAAPPFAVIGAASLAAARGIAQALSGLPIERVFVIHGAAGWDEPTPMGPFHVFDVARGRVGESMRDPLDTGLPRCAARDLKGGDAAFNARALSDVFGGASGAHRDALVLGAALALEVSGRCRDLDEGVDAAAAALADRRASQLLASVASFGARTGRMTHV
jgi:anthranilate phosphoribosyltransferase